MTDKTRIYICSPYTSQARGVEKLREEHKKYYNVSGYVAHLLRKEIQVFSPIVFAHNIAISYYLPGNVDFWFECEKAWIDWSTELHVYCDVGWEVSDGIDRELRYATRLTALFSREVKLIHPTTYEVIDEQTAKALA